MAIKRPTTIAEYIKAAPREGQPHLRRLYAILKQAAPNATSLIKWNTPFFIEPRFVYSFAANKAHIGFVTTPGDLEPFEKELKGYTVTMRGIIHLRYDRPLPEGLIRRIAEHRVRTVRNRTDKSFW